MRVTFIGSGNVATHLALALKCAGHEIIAICSRTIDSAALLADKLNSSKHSNTSTTFAHSYEDFHDNGSDIYIISVKDDAVSSIAKKLIPLAPNAIWAHTAGSLPMTAINGKRIGVFYPMQTFSKNKPVDISSVSIFIESNSSEQELIDLARSITKHVYQLDSDGRMHLHLAAVFACNFVNHCYALSEKILQNKGVPFEVMYPLIDETAVKAHIMSPREGQTGPAIRGDHSIMSKQMELLDNSKLIKEIYRLMSESIQCI